MVGECLPHTPSAGVVCMSERFLGLRPGGILVTERPVIFSLLFERVILCMSELFLGLRPGGRLTTVSHFSLESHSVLNHSMAENTCHSCPHDEDDLVS